MNDVRIRQLSTASAGFEAEFQRVLLEGSVSFEVRWQVQRWARRLPPAVSQPAKELSAQELDRLITQLDDDSFGARQGAAEHLRNLCIARGGDLRPCYPTDMCQIITALKKYEGQPVRVARADLDRAVELFFGPLDKGKQTV